ncbi:BTAD domain-containing putative transcriptional regulator [Pseudorhodoferax sp.]|uniref:BTAD domain-containing putative transcriptional regulator n=1 Tax=Pseudorhodoferax sp. TaxID=1993553 RepID=UPI002DD63EB4|nr:BTAD domain-containing putative transcriptional regulator [Pseudorhodoferax sp.]
METQPQDEAGVPQLRLQLLGPLAVWHGGVPVALPASRKVRALIAYLAAAPRVLSRAHLSELLWDQPNDPRGELRWCLSKARGVLDQPGCVRIASSSNGVQLDLRTVQADLAAAQAALQAGLAGLDASALRCLATHWRGDFAEGLELARSAAFSAWLEGQRRHWRAAHAQVLEHLAAALPPDGDEALDMLARWLQLAPYDRRAHQQMLQALARRGQWLQAEQHLHTAVQRFGAEGLDAADLVHAWRQARAQGAVPSSLPSSLPSSRPVPLPDPASPAPAAPWRRVSIAVMPFAQAAAGDAPAPPGLGAGLAYDITTRLAKLRSVFVIAASSTAALEARGLGAEEAARTLDVDYLASGTLQLLQGRLRVQVQLSEARTARIVWADTLQAPAPDTLAVLGALGDQLVAAIAGQVELAERHRAILKPPELLDAWEAHHRGLWHMYRFNAQDNAQAQQFFEAAIRRDPSFARPYAGLSFTHWQNAFLGWGPRASAVEQAWRTAMQGALADEQDPSARWALGRAHWLRGDTASALAELEIAVDLSPNFSLGHYTLAFVQAQSGDAEAAIRASDHARALSPFDPLLFAMLASRALALMRLGRHDEAANWAVRAIAQPNAHVHIQAIAAHCLALAERDEEARRVVAAMHARVPGYRVGDFVGAFRFAPDTEDLLRRAARRIGLG